MHATNGRTERVNIFSGHVVINIWLIAVMGGGQSSIEWVVVVACRLAVAIGDWCRGVCAVVSSLSVVTRPAE